MLYYYLLSIIFVLQDKKDQLRIRMRHLTLQVLTCTIICLVAWMALDVAEGCCCSGPGEQVCSDCNFFGCNCEPGKWHGKKRPYGLVFGPLGSRDPRGPYYCRAHTTPRGDYCYYQYAEPLDWCPDRRRKRSVNEPKAVYKEMFPGEWNRLDSWEEFGSIDADEDGSITFKEVLEFKNITDTTGVAYNWATRQFGRADSDNDGYVTPVEMQDYLQTEERE